MPRIRFHARAMSAWSRCGQPRLWQMPCFHSTLRGIVGHGLEPEPLRLDGLPDVDERVADDEHVPAERAAWRSRRDPALLGPGDEVVDEHADPPLRARAGSRRGARRGRRRRRGTPRPRPRAAGRRPTPSRRARRRGGPRRRSGCARATRALRPGTATDPEAVRVGAAGAAARGRTEDHRHALEQEAGAQREGTRRPAPVLERDRVEVPLDGDDLPAPVGGDLLDDQPLVGGDLDGPAALRGSPVGVEDVGAVAVGVMPGTRTVGARPGSGRLAGLASGPRPGEATHRDISSTNARDISSTVSVAEGASDEHVRWDQPVERGPPRRWRTHGGAEAGGAADRRRGCRG